MYNFSQEQVFILFFLVGIIIGIIFDFFRVIRKIFRVADYITFIQDIIFFILAGTIIISSIIIINGGEIRFYLFLAIFFGMLIYFLTISNLYVIIFYEIVNLCKKILKIPFLCLKKVFKSANTLIKKDFWFFCRIIYREEIWRYLRWIFLK